MHNLRVKTAHDSQITDFLRKGAASAFIGHIPLRSLVRLKGQGLGEASLLLAVNVPLTPNSPDVLRKV